MVAAELLLSSPSTLLLLRAAEIRAALRARISATNATAWRAFCSSCSFLARALSRFLRWNASGVPPSHAPFDSSLRRTENTKQDDECLVEIVVLWL